MKINSRQYAEGLYDLTLNKKEGEIKIVLEKFVSFLVKKNDLRKINQILDYFNKIWQEKNGFFEAELISARKLDKKIVKTIDDYLKELVGRNPVWQEKIDEKIIGGVIIKFQDNVIDLSVKGNLDNLKKEITNNF
jgi:F-type H+-transporting ATPase subunit delta